MVFRLGSARIGPPGRNKRVVDMVIYLQWMQLQIAIGWSSSKRSRAVPRIRAGPKLGPLLGLARRRPDPSSSGSVSIDAYREAQALRVLSHGRLPSGLL